MTKQPTIQQMKTRMNRFHREVLADAANATVRTGLSSEHIKSYQTAKKTLFSWGCLENGPMRRDANMATSYPLLLTDRGRALV